MRPCIHRSFKDRLRKGWIGRFRSDIGLPADILVIYHPSTSRIRCSGLASATNLTITHQSILQILPCSPVPPLSRHHLFSWLRSFGGRYQSFLGIIWRVRAAKRGVRIKGRLDICNQQGHRKPSYLNEEQPVCPYIVGVSARSWSISHGYAGTYCPADCFFSHSSHSSHACWLSSSSPLQRSTSAFVISRTVSIVRNSATSGSGVLPASCKNRICRQMMAAADYQQRYGHVILQW